MYFIFIVVLKANYLYVSGSHEYEGLVSKIPHTEL